MGNQDTADRTQSRGGSSGLGNLVAGTTTTRRRLPLLAILVLGCLLVASAALAFTLNDVTPLLTDAQDLGVDPSSLDLDGDTLAVGTAGQNDGLVTIFENSENAGGWVALDPLLPPAGVRGFGTALDLWSDVLTVGSGVSFTTESSVHVYRGLAGWQLEQPLSNPDAEFGHSMAIGNGLIAVGAPHWTDPPGNVVQPAVYLFEFEGGLWIPAGQPGWSPPRDVALARVLPGSHVRLGPRSGRKRDGDRCSLGRAYAPVISSSSDREGSASRAWTRSVEAPGPGGSGVQLRASDPDAFDSFGCLGSHHGCR